MNLKVLNVLIETQYCQSVLNDAFEKSDYPKFLIAILNNCTQNYIKHSVCRMIIKYFGGKKKGSDAANAAQDIEENAVKIEFINLVEPLIKIMSRFKESGVKLTALSIMAIVNMCNFSEDVKEMFLNTLNGYHIVCELLESKDEDVVLNTLKLIMTLITKKPGDTTQIGRDLAEKKEQYILRRLIKIVN
jgi:hypothetical protein